MTDSLHASIDGAITALLTRCTTVDTEGKQVSVPQHVDAIQAAIKWALTKAEIAAKIPVIPTTESAPDKKFQALKEGFHGGKSGRRPGRPPKYPRPDDETFSDGATPEIAAAPPDTGAAAINGAATVQDGTDEPGQAIHG